MIVFISSRNDATAERTDYLAVCLPVITGPA